MLRRILTFLAVALVVKVTFSVVLGYRDYFPPNFAADFLSGRENYFWGPYRWAFYSHIVTGPITLLLGLILVSERSRLRFPKWHRSFGKAQIFLVLFLLAPSGLWMARYALSGVVAAMGFAGLAIATWLCAWSGWRTAVQRRFAAHRSWMRRCFVLLCSAVVLRLIGGLATVTELGTTWSYPLAAWASWLVPLAVLELHDAQQRRLSHFTGRATNQSVSPRMALSLPAIEMSARR